MLLVHLEDGVILDGEKHKPLLIGLKDRFLDFRLLEDVIFLHRCGTNLILNYLSNSIKAVIIGKIA